MTTLLDVFQNPLIIAVCEIDDIKFGDDTWHVNTKYQHRNKKRKRHLMRIQVKTEGIVGELTPGAVILTVGRLTPSGSDHHTHVRAGYVKVVTADAIDMIAALDDATSQLNQQIAGIKRRMGILAEYQQLEAARRRLEDALCKLSN